MEGAILLFVLVALFLVRDHRPRQNKPYDGDEVL